MTIFHPSKICLSIGTVVLSGAAFGQTSASVQDRAAGGADNTKRILEVASSARAPGAFVNGQLLVQPRNALTMSGWTWDEQIVLCKQIDAGDQAALSTLHEEVQRQQPWAQRVMAMYFLKQRSPLVSADPARSLELYRLAAQQGDLSAQYELGWRLVSGTGFGADALEARYWLEKASAQDIATRRH